MSPASTTAFVVVSHSARLADGVVEVAAQMAPDVTLRAAGGTDDGGIGTSYDKVSGAVSELLEAGHEVVVVTDLGSATMTAESVLDMLDGAAAGRVLLADGPLVEGTVAGAVAAQGGAGAAAVAATVVGAAGSFAGAPVAGPAGQTATGDAVPAGADVGGGAAAGGAAGGGAPGGDGGGEVVARTLALTNEVGLHARPAALLARRASGFDAQVSVNDVDAASVLALMGLGLEKGDELHLRATGPQAAEAVAAVEELVAQRFGEA